jgi:3D (Asp-Asp-Asp) domain-containing protein
MNIKEDIMRNFSLATAAILFLSLPMIFAPEARAARPGFDHPRPFSLHKIGDLKPTFYWVALEQEDGLARNKELKDMDGGVLANVSSRFFSAIGLEGTGRLLDGRVLNYQGRVTLPDGKQEIRYIECPPEAPYGYGVDKIPLVPFRSVAVDPEVVPMGSRVYIPKAVGLALPDGSVHDGFFRAVDIGDAIRNHRIDMFTSFGDQSAVFERGGIRNMKPLEVYLVEE